jgi:hypothetical protein
MQPYRARIWLNAVFLCSCLLGCRSTSKAPPYPADPLFVIRKPEEAKAENAAPLVVVNATPEMPAVPAAVLAARQPPPGPATRPGFLPQPGEYRVGYPPNSSSP